MLNATMLLQGYCYSYSAQLQCLRPNQPPRGARVCTRVCVSVCVHVCGCVSASVYVFVCICTYACDVHQED